MARHQHQSKASGSLAQWRGAGSANHLGTGSPDAFRLGFIAALDAAPRKKWTKAINIEERK